jgi:hypothetical protein
MHHLQRWKRKQYPNQNKTEPSGGDKASFRLGYYSFQEEQMKVINFTKKQTKSVVLTLKISCLSKRLSNVTVLWREGKIKKI